MIVILEVGLIILGALNVGALIKYCIGVLRFSKCCNDEKINELERRTHIDLDGDGRIANECIQPLS